MGLGKVVPGNTEKGYKQPPYTEWEGMKVIPAEFAEEGWDPNLSSNPSDCTGLGVAVKVTGRPM